MDELLGYAPIIRMHTDSTAARSIGLKSGLCGLKHIDIKVLLLQQEVAAGRLIICKVDGKKNSADLLTKEVDGATLSRLIGFLGVCNDSENIEACEEGWQVVQHRRGKSKKLAFSSGAASLRALTIAGMVKKATSYNPLDDEESWSWQWHAFVVLMIIVASLVISVLVGTGAPQRALMRDDEDDQDAQQQSWQEMIAEARRDEDAWHSSGDGAEWAEYMGMDASQHEPQVAPADGQYYEDFAGASSTTTTTTRASCLILRTTKRSTSGLIVWCGMAKSSTSVTMPRSWMRRSHFISMSLRGGKTT
jgi:hypothetical protein